MKQVMQQQVMQQQVMQQQVMSLPRRGFATQRRVPGQIGPGKMLGVRRSPAARPGRLCREPPRDEATVGPTSLWSTARAGVQIAPAEVEGLGTHECDADELSPLVDYLVTGGLMAALLGLAMLM